MQICQCASNAAVMHLFTSWVSTQDWKQGAVYFMGMHQAVLLLRRPAPRKARNDSKNLAAAADTVLFSDQLLFVLRLRLKLAAPDYKCTAMPHVLYGRFWS